MEALGFATKVYELSQLPWIRDKIIHFHMTSIQKIYEQNRYRPFCNRLNLNDFDAKVKEPCLES